MKKEGNSYGHILRTSSIIAASQVVTYALGMVRIKALALLLGPTGVGLLGYFQSAAALIGTATSLGVASSGVRDVAAASAAADEARMGRTVRVLHRVCWFTGGAGLLAAVALAWPLSRWSFGTAEQAWAIALLGLSLLFTAISSGQTALVQGLRRIGDLVRINVAGALLGTVASLVCYFGLGVAGIAPGLVLAAACT
jgi:PST family polysaccharide transporter